MKRMWAIFRYELPLHMILRLTDILPDNVVFLRLRGWLAKHFVGGCGGNLRLGRCISIYSPWNIFFGKDVYVAYGCWFNAAGNISIGDEVLFGPYCILATSNHTRVNDSYRYGPPSLAPIEIGKGSWLGSHVTLTSGTKVGSGCLLGAGSVASGEFPPNSFAGGIPAKVLKQID